ncbi:MAG: RNase adapter RapZ [Caldimicrobium sp.]
MTPYIVIITGESGAGKSTILKALEDLDFLAIDNFPASLFLPLLDNIQKNFATCKIALVMDLRDPNFLEEFPKILETLKEKKYQYDIIYLSADLPTLITRFSQTRRPHPMLKETNDLRSAILLEKEKLSTLREWATLFLDTSRFNVHQLRHEIFKIYGSRKILESILLQIIAFGYKYGLPYEANYLFDARVLPNPYFIPELKPLTGEHKEVQEFLLEKQETQVFIESIVNFLRWALPLHKKEGRRYIVCGIGCTGGRHRSPAIALFIAEKIKKLLPEVEVVVTLRDVNRE